MGQPCESSSKCSSGFCGADGSWAECGISSDVSTAETILLETNSR